MTTDKRKSGRPTELHDDYAVRVIHAQDQRKEPMRYLAHELGLSPASLSHRLTGRIRWRQLELDKIEELLGVSALDGADGYERT